MSKKDLSPAEAEALDIEMTEFEVAIVHPKTKVEATIKIECAASVDDAPIEVMEAMEDGKYLKAFMAMIGPETAYKLRSAGMTGRVFADDVLPKWQEATGLGEG
ncbi:hypothetical protein WG936_08210 [Corynebacterium sp. H127]|uniref:hypothetical protein n=1 Tax=Corynebacterium sp. H127 TaxID=3133418 RepID=UPI0030AA824B